MDQWRGGVDGGSWLGWLLAANISAHPCTSQRIYDNICGNLFGNLAKSTDCIYIGISDVQRIIVEVVPGCDRASLLVILAVIWTLASDTGQEDSIAI